MVKRVISKLPVYHKITTKPPAMALRTVTSKEGLGVYASSDTLFKGAIFGRDSLEVAEDLMWFKPKLSQRIILTLASLQGEEWRDDNEEEPGKIVHEYRRAVVDGKPLEDVSRHIFGELSTRWGGNDISMAYYGSVDATPHFVIFVSRYIDANEPSILKSKVKLRSGHVITLSIAVENALSWMLDHLKNSKSGMLEYKRRNPQGIENQVWKDSKEFYVHENGQIANHDAPISSIEVQALAHEALMGAARLFPHRADELQAAAKKLRETTIKTLWIADRKYFALGTDYDEHGKLRVIMTKTANPAELLDSDFLDDLSENDKEKYIGGMVREIMGDDFLTDGGIRSRGRDEAELIPFWDYHGSYTSWPKETYDIAKGLRRQGFKKLAIELENRLLNVVGAAKAYPEFIYVDARGRVLGTASSAHHHAELVLVDSTNEPEKIQAWTVSAVVAILADRKLSISPKKIIRRKKPSQAYESWQNNLEREVLTHIPVVPRLKTPRELSARYPAYPYAVRNGGKPSNL